MIARFTSAGFALLAFSIAVIAGLLSHNPVEVVLSRGLLALLFFFTFGLVLGHAAQRVVDEYERKETLRIRDRYSSDIEKEDSSMAGATASVGAQGGAKS